MTNFDKMMVDLDMAFYSYACGDFYDADTVEDVLLSDNIYGLECLEKAIDYILEQYHISFFLFYAFDDVKAYLKRLSDVYCINLYNYHGIAL